jgi:hypothetical protein
MAQHLPHKPHHTRSEDDDPQPGALPVEPDKGSTPPDPPEDGDHDRERSPEA